jgi:hypothetical protein
MKNTLKLTQNPALLENLAMLLEAHRKVFQQTRIYHRVVALVIGELFTFGRHTITQILLTLGLNQGDWSAWYRLFSQERFEMEELSEILFEETLAHVSADDVYVAGVDGFQVPRCSKTMPGTSWLKAPRTPVFKVGIHRAQRFLNGSWLTPPEQGYSRAIPLRLLPAFTAKAVLKEQAAHKEWEAGLMFIKWLRSQLDRVERKLQNVLVLGDGSYDNLGLWKSLPERVVLLVRTAKNRRLHAMPEPQPGRGRRRKYGERVRTPQEWLHERKGWQTTTLTIRKRKRILKYRVEGPFLRYGAPDRPLFLIVVKGQSYRKGRSRKGYRKPAFYLVNATEMKGQWRLPLPAHKLLFWTWQRWELEVTHREMKCGFGLGQKQCWNPRAAVVSVQWSVWVYALLVLAGYRTWGLCQGPAAPARWWSGAARWSFNTLWRSYRAEFWNLSDFRPLCLGFTDDWWKKEPLLAGLLNSALGSTPS